MHFAPIRSQQLFRLAQFIVDHRGRGRLYG